MIKWFICLILGHNWILKGKTYQRKEFRGKPIRTINFILERCEKCGKFREHETQAFYDKIEA